METFHFKNEDQMQAYVVKWFSEEYPQAYGSLFKVNNESKNAMFQIATGLIPGVSDLVLFYNNKFAGIELKMPCGKKKNKTHVETQLSWGEHIIKNGGEYLMSESVEEIKEFINRLMQPSEYNNKV